MIRLEYPGGHLDLGPTAKVVDSSLARSGAMTPAGQVVMVGDGGWDPGTLTLRCRVSDASSATPGDGALRAVEALAAAAEAANAVHHLGPGAPHTTYVLGLRRLSRRPRGTWWDVELVFLPRRLRGTSGSGRALTVNGSAVTTNGEPVTIEVM